MKKQDLEKIIKDYQTNINNKQGNFVNTTLNTNNVIDEYNKVDEFYKTESSKIKNPIKIILACEAPRSAKNYIYNINGETTKTGQPTDFLKPAHLNCEKDNKVEMLKYLGSKGVLIFDIYPLPFPSFIYNEYDLSSKHFSDDLNIYNDFWDEKLKGISIPESLEIGLGFEKLRNRPLFNRFRDFLNQKYNVPKSKNFLSLKDFKQQNKMK